MIYTVNIKDIEVALVSLGGEAKAKDIQDSVLAMYCSNKIPDNYQHEKSFRQTIQRKIEDYCPQAEGFDSSKKEGKFLRIGHGLYRTTLARQLSDFPSLEEVIAPEKFYEGATTNIYVNAYERSQQARKSCIDHYGWSCQACGFDFRSTYGEIGKAFIHVHHIKALSEVGKMYLVDPIQDLIPLCANCHAIVHRVAPALSVDQLKKVLQR